MEEERRKHPRVTLKWPIAAETEERIVYGTTADISSSGAFINCHNPLDPGEIFDLIIQDVSLVDCPLPLDSFIRISAGVVRTQDYDPDRIIFSHGMAVRFLRMLENEHEVISTLITHTLQKDRIDWREEEQEK
jgi:hypothetical protein